MIFVWLAASLNYYLLSFLVSNFSAEYASDLGLGIADFFAYSTSAYVYQKCGIKASICGSYLVATVAGVFLLFYGLDH